MNAWGAQGRIKVEFLWVYFELGSAAVAGRDLWYIFCERRNAHGKWNAHEMIMGRVWEVEKWNGRGGREDGRQESPYYACRRKVWKVVDCRRN